MDTPDINTIKTMPKKDLEALNNKLARRFATHMVGLIFIKLTVRNVAVVLAKKAIITAAKRA
jgi:hypothetical protein